MNERRSGNEWLSEDAAGRKAEWRLEQTDDWMYHTCRLNDLARVFGEPGIIYSAGWWNDEEQVNWCVQSGGVEWTGWSAEGIATARDTQSMTYKRDTNSSTQGRENRKSTRKREKTGTSWQSVYLYGTCTHSGKSILQIKTVLFSFHTKYNGIALHFHIFNITMSADTRFPTDSMAAFILVILLTDAIKPRNVKDDMCSVQDIFRQVKQYKSQFLQC